MTTDKREPAYRAAYDSAQTELGQIYERLSQLRARQEQIQVAADALKLLVGNDGSYESASPSVSSKAVFEIKTNDFLPSTPAVDEEPTDLLQKQIKAALRVPVHA